MNKKILMLSLIDPQKNDASKIHFYELANSFVNNGHEVTLLVPRNKLQNNLTKAQNIIQLPLNYIENFLRIFILSILQIIYYLFISSNEYDFVYIRWRLLPSFFLKIINMIKFSKAQIVTEHNGWIELEAKIQHENVLFSKIGYFLQMLDAKFSDKIIVVTKGIKIKLIEHGIARNKIYVIGNGTNLEHFYPVKNRAELKKSFLKTNKPVLGFIGNISRWQGIDALIDGFEKIHQENDEVVLLIIGTGIYLEELKEKIAKLNFRKAIYLQGNIEYSEINNWMNVIDIAFTPKSFLLNEIGYSPLKVRDYAAAGKPVISTNVNGIKELEKFGWLFTYNPEIDNDLENTIMRVLDQDLDSLGKKARNYAENNFSWDQIAKKIIEIFG